MTGNKKETIRSLRGEIKLLNESMNTRIDGVVRRMGELTTQVDNMLKSVDSKSMLLMERLDASSTNEPSATTRLVTDSKTAEIAQQALQQASAANQQTLELANAVGGQLQQQQLQQLQLQQHSNIITNATSGAHMWTPTQQRATTEIPLFRQNEVWSWNNLHA